MRDHFLLLLLISFAFQAVIGVETNPKVSKVDAGDNTPSPDKTTTTASPTSPQPSPITTKATTVTPPTTPPPTTPPPITSTVAPTTTVTPSPKPKKKDFWVVSNGTNNCIIASMKIQLDIPYNDSTSKPAMAHVQVPEYSDGSGSCNYTNSAQMLSISWANKTNWINFTFEAEMSNSSSNLYKHFWISEIKASVTVDNKTFPNITGGIKNIDLVNNTQQFLTPMGVSFSCSPVTNVPSSENPAIVNQTAYFSLSHVQVQAFRNSTDEKFSSAIFCENGNTPDLVPILVGCALVGLVIIVLVAYIYSRWRSQQRGYLSM